MYVFRSYLRSFKHGLYFFWQKGQGPLRCNLVTEQPGFFYPIYHNFLMDALHHTNYIAFLSVSTSSWEWITQGVGVPIPIKKGHSTILLHDRAFSEEDCLSIDLEVQLYVDKSHVFGGKFTPPPPPPTSISASALAAASLALSPPVTRPLSRPARPLPFPLTYVCDMIPGLTRLMYVLGADKLEEAFRKAFPQCNYGKTSVKIARNLLWRALQLACGDTSDLVLSYIKHGRSQEGLWKSFKNVVNGTIQYVFCPVSPSLKFNELGVNPSTQNKLLITDEMKNALLALEIDMVDAENRPGVSPHSSTLPHSSTSAQSSTLATASDSDEEKDEDDYDLLPISTLQQYKFRNGQMETVGLPGDLPGTGLLRLKPIAIGHRHEVYMVRFQCSFMHILRCISSSNGKQFFSIDDPPAPIPRGRRSNICPEKNCSSSRLV